MTNRSPTFLRGNWIFFFTHIHGSLFVFRCIFLIPFHHLSDLIIIFLFMCPQPGDYFFPPQGSFGTMRLYTLMPRVSWEREQKITGLRWYSRSRTDFFYFGALHHHTSFVQLMFRTPFSTWVKQTHAALVASAVLFAHNFFVSLASQRYVWRVCFENKMWQLMFLKS